MNPRRKCKKVCSLPVEIIARSQCHMDKKKQRQTYLPLLSLLQEIGMVFRRNWLSCPSSQNSNPDLSSLKLPPHCCRHIKRYAASWNRFFPRAFTNQHPKVLLSSCQKPHSSSSLWHHQPKFITSVEAWRWNRIWKRENGFSCHAFTLQIGPVQGNPSCTWKSTQAPWIIHVPFSRP